MQTWQCLDDRPAAGAGLVTLHRLIHAAIMLLTVLHSGKTFNSVCALPAVVGSCRKRIKAIRQALEKKGWATTGY